MNPTTPAARPRFSIVTAVYNAEQYLDDFIASLDAQSIDPADLEVIAVDDGSTDGSLAALEAWRARAPYRVEVAHQANAGQAAARNTGLARATGTWVTFTDPDDRLGPWHLQEARAFADAHPRVEVLAANVVTYDESRDRVNNNHPRRWQFAQGTRVANLDDEPNVFPGSSTVSLFRLDRIRDAGLAFDADLRPTFEDGHFTCRFLLALDRPVAGLLAKARYIYRKRSSNDSTLQRSFRDPGRYTTIFERGLLDIMDRARTAKGSVPAWLQQVVIYELSWFLSESDAISSRLAVPDELRDRFEDLFGETARSIDPAVLRAHRVRTLTPAWLDFLEHGYRSGDWRSMSVTRTATDPAMRLQRVVYRYAGAGPAETVTVDGIPTAAAFSKRMAISYFGLDRMTERILWLPDGRVDIALDGRQVPVTDGLDQTGVARPEAHTRRAASRRGRLRARIGPRRLVAEAMSRTRRAAWLVAARLASVRYRNAWVLVDRVHDADDNAERLFEHLVRERPDISAWFTLEAHTPDWTRMRKAGHRRLVAYGGWRWRLLMLNARWVLSSHADLPIVRPPSVLEVVSEPRWNFALLQHGVIKDDLSPWLNTREMNLFVVSTEAELQSVVADGTHYRATAKEACLTGLPRFDRLLAKGREHPADAASLVLVAPTWRSWLTLPLLRGSQRHDLHAEFWASDYHRAWIGLLRSPHVEAAVAARGLRLAFMPHPNLQAILDDLDLPDHVEALSFSGNDVQALYAQTALLVTDYSSVAFNLAYLNRPVVYYQFDRDRIRLGEHVGRGGYFDYDRDGYGPVVLDHDAAVAAVVAAIEAGPQASPAYATRVAQAFPVRDGRACERVIAAVEERSRPWVPRAP